MRPKRQTYRIFYLLVYIFTAFIIHYPAINFKGFKEKFIKFIPPAAEAHMGWELQRLPNS